MRTGSIQTAQLSIEFSNRDVSKNATSEISSGLETLAPDLAFRVLNALAELIEALDGKEQLVRYYPLMSL